MTINKRAGRSIKKNIAFYIISIILTMLTSMVIVAAVSTGHTLTKVVDDFVKDYKAEDAEFVTYQPLSDADMEKLEQEYDVILEHSRYKDVNVESGDLKGATIRVFPMPEKLNLCEVRDGHEPGDGEALLTQDFADVHDIKVGDTVSLGSYDYKVSAYTTKADYIYMLDKLSGYIDSEKFALVVVNRKEYDNIDADETSYYSIKYNKDNSKEVREKLNEGYVIASYMAATTNTRISMPVNEGDAVTNMATMYAPVMFIIIITLVVMVLGRNIRQEQYLLGTFLALGFSKKQIIRHYMRYGVLPGVVGSVLGLIVSVPLTGVLCRFYIEYDFEKLTYTPTYDVPSIVAALVVPTILYCAAIEIQAAKLLKKSSVDLLRNTGKDTKTVGVMKKSHAKTQTKMRVRSVIGHPGRSIVTAFGVAVAAFCILTGFIMKDSLDTLMHGGLTSSIKYEYLYRLNSLEEGTPEQGEALFQNYYEVEGNTVQLLAQGISKDSKYFPDKTDGGDALDLDKYYLTSAAAQTYGIKTGDTLTFSNIADLKEHKVTISGIVTDNTHCYLYTGRENATALAGCCHFHISAQAFARSKHNTAHNIVTDMLGYFHDAFLSIVHHIQGILNPRKVPICKLDIDNRSGYLYDLTFIFHHAIVHLACFFFFFLSALAPPITSVISCVIAAWRTRLNSIESSCSIACALSVAACMAIILAFSSLAEPSTRTPYIKPVT